MGGDGHNWYLERRAESLGLPTDPEAYRDGGPAMAFSAHRLEAAEVAASVLRAAGIPAWVEGVHILSWCWHYQFTLYPRGVRVMVPRGRLEEAREVLTPEATVLEPAQAQGAPEPTLAEIADDVPDPAPGGSAWPRALPGGSSSCCSRFPA